MRIPVVSKDGKPLMPTKPAKARKMIEGGVAKKCWSKTGVFYLKMLMEVGEKVQDMALAIDPGSNYDGYAISGEKEVALKGMAVLPSKVSDKLTNRRQLRRARRYRKTRRRTKRFDNRKRREGWIAPSQKAKVQLRIKIVRDMVAIFPINYLAIEDVRFNHYQKRWGKFFSTAEIGKTMLYKELSSLMVICPECSEGSRPTCGELFIYEGWQTAEARKYYGIVKKSQKDALTPESHANDAVAMLSLLFGRNVQRHSFFFVWRRLEFVRRSLHRQNFMKGGIRPSFGSTTNSTFFRKGDYVEASQGQKTFRGWVCGLSTKKTKVVAVCTAEGKRLGQCSVPKVKLLRRSTGVSWQFLPA